MHLGLQSKVWAELERDVGEGRRQIGGDTEPEACRKTERQGHEVWLGSSDNMRNRNDFWILLVLGYFAPLLASIY